MRGTLHIVAAEDLGWMLNLARERQVRGSATRRNGLELSDRDLEIAREAAIVALTGRLCLTRDQLYEVFGLANADDRLNSVERGGETLYFASETDAMADGARWRSGWHLEALAIKTRRSRFDTLRGAELPVVTRIYSSGGRLRAFSG